MGPPIPGQESSAQLLKCGSGGPSETRGKEEDEEDEEEDSSPDSELDDDCLRKLRHIELHKLAFESFDDPRALSKVQADLRREFPGHDEGLQHLSGTKWSHLQKLKALWRDVHPQEFMEMVVSAGPKAGWVMNAFTVKVTERQQKSLQWLSITKCVGVTKGDFKEGDTVPQAVTGPAIPIRPPRKCGMRPQKVKVCIVWCGLRDLLHSDPLHDNDDRNVFALKALAESSEDSDIFSTPLGQAVLQHNWNLALRYYLWQRFMDVVFVLALIWLSQFSRRSQETHHKHLPSKHHVDCMLVICAYNVYAAVVGVVACTLIYGSLRPYTYPWNFCCWVFDICSSAFLGKGLWILGTLGYTSLEMKATFFYRHPIALSCILLGKWCQLGVHMLNSEMLAMTVLPAWIALRSCVSLTFIAWILYLLLGTAFSYLALPINDFSDNVVEDFRSAIMRMLRLNLMSDFDMSEMEGVDQLIEDLNITTGRGGHITDGQPVDIVHDDLRYMTLALGVVFPITLLNVYITMVGNAYSEACARIRETAGRFNTVSMVPPLMTRHFYMRALRSLGCTTRRVPVADGGTGLWISVPHGLLSSAPPG